MKVEHVRIVKRHTCAQVQAGSLYTCLMLLDCDLCAGSAMRHRVLGQSLSLQHMMAVSCRVAYTKETLCRIDPSKLWWKKSEAINNSGGSPEDFYRRSRYICGQCSCL